MYKQKYAQQHSHTRIYISIGFVQWGYIIAFFHVCRSNAVYYWSFVWGVSDCMSSLWLFFVLLFDYLFNFGLLWLSKTNFFYICIDHCCCCSSMWWWCLLVFLHTNDRCDTTVCINEMTNSIDSIDLMDKQQQQQQKIDFTSFPLWMY